MTQIFRIVAEHAGDNGSPRDSRWKIVFDGIVDNETLQRQRCFGFAMEVDEETGSIGRWPFILEPRDGEASGAMDFGAGADSYEAINIFDKKIFIGAKVTRGIGEEESCYQIVTMEKLI